MWRPIGRSTKGPVDETRGGLLVGKSGGSVAGVEGALLDDIAGVHAEGYSVLLVHGGAPDIDRELQARAIPTKRIRGLRCTTQSVLGVIECVLCGSVNKRLVRQLGARGVPAIGLSGEDGALLVAEPDPQRELGFVGRVQSVNPKPVRLLLGVGYVPVVAPLAVGADYSQAYNVNADAAAGAMQAEQLVFITDVRRLLSDPCDASSAIDTLTAAQAWAFMQGKSCGDGY